MRLQKALVFLTNLLKAGLPRKTIEHYAKFLYLWKDADPGILEVEDAKKMLAGLKGQ